MINGKSLFIAWPAIGSQLVQVPTLQRSNLVAKPGKMSSDKDVASCFHTLYTESCVCIIPED